MSHEALGEQFGDFVEDPDYEPPHTEASFPNYWHHYQEMRDPDTGSMIGYHYEPVHGTHTGSDPLGGTRRLAMFRTEVSADGQHYSKRMVDGE